MTGYRKKETSPLSKKVEAFALNLLHLIRGVRVYPAKHPTLVGIVKNVLDSAPLDLAGLLTIGVTSRELVVSGEFVAGKATHLASMLHARKVLQIFWTKDVALEHVWTFAQVLSTPKLEGVELQQKLRSEGIYTIEIEPLRLDQIHSEITDSVKNSGENPEKRRRRAWLTLMSHEAPAEQLASALASQEFWEAAKTEWEESGYGDSEGFTRFLLTLGERLEDALTLLPGGQRQDTLDYLAQMGKSLSVRDLVQIVGLGSHESRGLGPGKSSLLREIDVDRFVDILAGLATLGDQGRRFVEVYRRFAPVSKTDDILSLVRSRLSSGKGSGFAGEVWKTVEDLIRNLTENPFMDAEDSRSSEFLVNPSVSMRFDEEAPVSLENPDEYLDHLILALAVEEEEDSKKRLLDRIKVRAQQIGPFRILEFVRVVDRAFPGWLDATPSLIRDLFLSGLSAVSRASLMEQQALVNFAVSHEKRLLDTALKALAEEKKIATRHFLVNLLSYFSSAATPSFVLKSRTSPWYVARNLAIVLGQQGLPQVLAPLRALSNHTHPKVRREAIRAIKTARSSLYDLQREHGEEAVMELNLQDPGNGEETHGT